MPAESNVVRVVIVDDHPIVREGLRACLGARHEIEVVGDAADGAEALERVTELRPDVVLMDVSMPKLGGIEATSRLLDLDSAVKVLMLTMHNSQAVMQASLRAGASGFVVKDSSPDVLSQAIREVMAGERFIDEAVGPVLPSKGANGGEEHITPREREVLLLVADGLRNKEIAERLGVSRRTVETHRARLSAKLGIRTSAGLARYAMERGLLRPAASAS